MRKVTRRSHLCSSVIAWDGFYTLNVRLEGENVIRGQSVILPLILDTGARFIGVTKHYFDTTLNLRRVGSEKIQGVNGPPQDAPATWANIIVDERIAIPNMRIVQLQDYDQGNRIAGLLGMEFLSKIQLYMDVSRVVSDDRKKIPLIRFYYPPEYEVEG